MFQLYKNHNEANDEDGNSSKSSENSSRGKGRKKKKGGYKEVAEDQARMFSLKEIMKKSESFI